MLCEEAQVRNYIEEISHVRNTRNFQKQIMITNSIHICSSSKRPERLISKLKTMNLEDAARGGKKIVVIRQPRGPEGVGFKATRNV